MKSFACDARVSLLPVNVVTYQTCERIRKMCVIAHMRYSGAHGLVVAQPRSEHRSWVVSAGSRDLGSSQQLAQDTTLTVAPDDQVRAKSLSSSNVYHTLNIFQPAHCIIRKKPLAGKKKNKQRLALRHDYYASALFPRLAATTDHLRSFSKNNQLRGLTINRIVFVLGLLRIDSWLSTIWRKFFKYRGKHKSARTYEESRTARNSEPLCLYLPRWRTASYSALEHLPTVTGCDRSTPTTLPQRLRSGTVVG